MNSEDMNAAVIFTRDTEGHFTLELSSATAVADRMGRHTFLAFARCFAGADRLLALQHLYRLNEDTVPVSSVAHWRNWKLVVVSTVGLAHELGKALQGLARTGIPKTLTSETWDPLDAIRKKWKTHPVLSKFRNQVAFHLGDADVYESGLQIAGSSTVVFSDGDKVDDAQGAVAFPFAWDLVLDGMQLNDVTQVNEALGDVVRDTFNLPRLLVNAFGEAFRRAGVREVVRKVEALPPPTGSSRRDHP